MKRRGFIRGSIKSLIYLSTQFSSNSNARATLTIHFQCSVVKINWNANSCSIYETLIKLYYCWDLNFYNWLKINVATNTKLKLNYRFRENKVIARWKLIQGILRKIRDSGNNCGDKISMTSKRKQFSHGIHGAAKTRNFNFLDFLLFLFLTVLFFFVNLADLSIEGTST